VFSPWYAWARRGGRIADPLNHCALNVSLYGVTRRWSLTERGAGAVQRDAETLRIGPSALHWDGNALTIEIAELTAPLPSRLRGTVRVVPRALPGASFALDADGRHRWTPIAPAARVEVAMDRPFLRWSGDGYLDSNDGDAPLEQDFEEWDWCRAPLTNGTAVLYSVTRRAGGDQALALRFDASGVTPLDPPPRAQLPRTRWRLARRTRCEPGGAAEIRQTLQDSPFYARSVVTTRICGEDVTALHESLSLNRFAHPLVQAMLPFRIPRALA
jgi:carotenoid 1,2-hydratase